jgi:hypothetical protein
MKNKNFLIAFFVLVLVVILGYFVYQIIIKKDQTDLFGQRSYSNDSQVIEELRQAIFPSNFPFEDGVIFKREIKREDSTSVNIEFAWDTQNSLSSNIEKYEKYLNDNMWQNIFGMYLVPDSLYQMSAEKSGESINIVLGSPNPASPDEIIVSFIKINN